MNSLVVKAKRFLGNKKTVTILCVIAGIIVLFVGYNWRLNEAIDPIRVPYAKTKLEARHVITEDDIGYIEINSSVFKKGTNIVQDINQLIGKEVTYGNVIQAGSLFYTEDVTDPSLSPDYVLSDIEDGYTAFSLSVDQFTTYNNYITIGSYIDLWYVGEDDYDKIIYTRFVESIRVLDVRDSKGVSLNNSTSEEPAELLFAVPDDLYSLLVKATELGDLEPAPKGASYTANPGETSVSSEYVRRYIEEKSAVIPDETTSSNTTTGSTTNTQTGTGE